MMMGLGAIALALASSCSAPEPRPRAPTGAEASLEASLWFIELDARRERRQRITSGIAQVVTGALQASLGLYLLIDPPTDDDSVEVSGILNTAAGSGHMLQGILGLTRPGPLEVLVRDPAFERAKRSAAGRAWIERRLERGARRGRIERIVAGSLSLAGGVAIIGLGINNLVDEDLAEDPAQVVLGASQIGAAMGFSTFGIRELVLPSQAEHTLRAWRRGGFGSRASRRRSISVSPTLAGLQISGRF